MFIEMLSFEKICQNVFDEMPVQRQGETHGPRVVVAVVVVVVRAKSNHRIFIFAPSHLLYMSSSLSLFDSSMM